jgi:LmbE family N-acetylglucosaminyl deacetylase
MKLDTVPHMQINKIIETKLNDFAPDVIFTHHWGDLNKDHRYIFESTMVATRPNYSPNVKKIYCYEIPSSTEWQSPNISYRFNPNVYTDISDQLDAKIKAINCYESEIRQYPHPRSPKSIEIYSKRNGIIINKEAAERFVLVREII